MQTFGTDCLERKQNYIEYCNSERLAHRPVYSNVAQWEREEMKSKRTNYDNFLIIVLSSLAILQTIEHFNIL